MIEQVSSLVAHDHNHLGAGVGEFPGEQPRPGFGCVIAGSLGFLTPTLGVVGYFHDVGDVTLPLRFGS
jgi:hypothetical protein